MLQRLLSRFFSDHCWVPSVSSDDGVRGPCEQLHRGHREPRRGRRTGGSGVAIVPFAQAHVGRDVPLRVGHAEAAGPVDAGRPGTAALRQPARGHVHAPRRQAGRTVENVRPALRVAGVRPERAAVRAPVPVAHQAAFFLPRIQHRPAAAVARGRGPDQETRGQRRDDAVCRRLRRDHLAARVGVTTKHVVGAAGADQARASPDYKSARIGFGRRRRPGSRARRFV